MGINEIGLYILGAGLLTWVCLIFAGLIIITTKLFNQDNVTLQCPNVDLKTSHIQDGVTFVKFISLIDKEITKSETVIKIDSTQLGITRMSIIMFWITMFPIFIYGIFRMVKRH